MSEDKTKNTSDKETPPKKEVVSKSSAKSSTKVPPKKEAVSKSSAKSSTKVPPKKEVVSKSSAKSSTKVPPKKEAVSKSSTKAPPETVASPSKESSKKESGVAVNNAKEDSSKEIKLQGLIAFKEGMSSVYDEKGRAVPVTVLKYKTCYISQLKTKKQDGYEAVQIACDPKKVKNSLKSEIGHLKGSGFENGARVIKEIRQSHPEGVSVGQRVLIESFQKGDVIKLTGVSKGKGFAGVVKRWNFAGGPASHGSGFHRRPGSIGNNTDPARVMPGRKMAGHFGVDQVSIPNVEVVDVIADENVLLVKGSVPGSKNSLVQLMKHKV